MNHILVGFKDLGHSESTAVGLFHTDSGQIRPLLERPASANAQGGVEALAASEDYLYVAVEGQTDADTNTPSILIFDRERFRLVGRDLLTGLSDIRSLLYLDGSLYIVSAGTEEVFAYRADQGRLTGEPFRWRPTLKDSEADRHDLNSLAFFQGEVVVSGRLGNLDNGFLLSMTRSEPVSQAEGIGIGAPGAIAVVNDSLIYGEESTGTLRRLKDGYSRRLGGRLLAICSMDSELFIGLQTETGCELHRLSAEDFREQQQYDLSNVPGRITALLPVDDVRGWPPEPEPSWHRIPARPRSHPVE